MLKKQQFQIHCAGLRKPNFPINCNVCCLSRPEPPVVRGFWLRLRKLLQVRAAGCRHPVAQPEPESRGWWSLHLSAVHCHDARGRPVVLDPHLVHRERLPRWMTNQPVKFWCLPVQAKLSWFPPCIHSLQASTGSPGHGTSLSLRPTGAGQPQPPLARTTTCWNTLLWRAVK